MPPSFSIRDEQRLTGVHPALVVKLSDVFAVLQRTGHVLFVIEGVRSTARQASLYTVGRTLPGTIVTYKDGVTHRSNHQPHADGYGYAADCAFVDRDPFSLSHPWERYGAELERRGLVWGGRWRMSDLEHAELPDVPVVPVVKKA